MFTGDLFGNLVNPRFIGDVSVNGDLIVTGNITHAGELTSTDNLIILNEGEVGAGVTAGFAGIEIDRGTETAYRFIFDEVDDVFKIGEVGSLQSVVTRLGPITEGKIAFGSGVDAYTEDNLFHYDVTNNRLGIGTAAPTQKLQVFDSSAIDVNLLVSNPINFASIGVASTGETFITAGGNMRMTSNGLPVILRDANRIGINGPSDASYDVHITGVTRVTESLSVSLAVTAQNFVGSGNVANSLTRTGALDTEAILDISNASGVTGRFLRNGNFNVGTTESTSKVHIHVDSAAENHIHLTNNDTGVTAGNGVLFGIDASENLDIRQREASDMIFYTSDTERMRLLANGKLGINTATPTAMLDVAGTTRITGVSAPTSGSGVEIVWTGTQGEMIAYDRTGSNYLPMNIFGNPVTIHNQATAIFSVESNGIALSGGDTIRRNQNASGLDITGSVASNNSAALYIYGNAHPSQANNIYMDGSTIFFRSHLDSERMRLDNIGLGIGKAPSYPLDVNGIMNATEIYENGAPFVTSTLWDANTSSDTVTPAATWDDYVGIGITAPDNILHVHKASAATTDIKLTNQSTGTGAGSGLELLINASRDTFLKSYENRPLYIGTNSVDFITVEATGRVSINPFAGFTPLVANRSGPDGDTIQVNNDGTLTFSIGSNVNNGYINVPDTLEFRSASTTRGRINSLGHFLWGKSSTSSTVSGFMVEPQGDLYVTQESARCLYLNRLTTSGNIMEFAFDSNLEANISISSTDFKINSSGRFLFGTGGNDRGAFLADGTFTVKKIVNDAGATEGVEFQQGGNNYMTTAGGVPLSINRLTNSGPILQVRQQSVELGSIGSDAGDMWINSVADLYFRTGGLNRVSISSAGLALGTGPSVDTIQTTLVSTDGAIATSKAIIDYGNANWGGGGGTTDHGALTGLGDNDHPQYALKAGDTLTGQLNMATAASASVGIGMAGDTDTGIGGQTGLTGRINMISNGIAYSYFDDNVFGTQKIDINSSAGLHTLANPTIRFVSTGNGFYNAGSDSIQVGVSGALSAAFRSGGLQVANGVVVNDFRTSLLNNDTSLVTGAGIRTYIRTNIHDEFTAGNLFISNSGDSDREWELRDDGFGTGLQFRKEDSDTLMVTMNTGGLTVHTGGFFAPSGTSGAPSYSFNGDGDTGMYRIGADILGFTTGGAERARFTSGGSLFVATLDGTDTNPGHAFASSGFVRHVRSGNLIMELVRRDTFGALISFNYEGNSEGLIGINDVGDLRFQADASLVFDMGSTTEMTLDTSGMALKTGPSVNEIETTLTNDDTHIPTSGAVNDAIAAATFPTFAVVSGDGVDNSSVSDTITVNQTGIGNSDQHSEIEVHISIDDNVNDFEIWTLTLIKPKGGTTWHYRLNVTPGNNNQNPLNLQRSSGSGTYSTNTLIGGFTVYNSTNTITNVSLNSTANSFTISLQRVTGTPQIWQQLMFSYISKTG